MKVIINASNLTVGGGIQVALSFIHLLPKYTEHSFYVVVSSSILKQINFAQKPSNIIIKELNFGIKQGFKKNKSLMEIERKFNPDIVFTVFGPSYWTPKAAHLMGFALGWLINPNTEAFKVMPLKQQLKKYAQNKFKAFYTKKNGSKYVVETEDVKERLTTYLKIPKEEIWVVNNTYNQFFNQAISSVKKRDDVFKLVTISANYPHKNLAIIKKVVEILKKKKLKVQFTLTIPLNDYEEVFKGFEENVVTLGPIEAKDCPEHYRNADAFFLPTLLECFTASYPEAMIMKKPILTSDLGFAKTICGEGNALFFNPTDPKDIAAKIELLIKNEALGLELIENGLKRVKEFSSSEERAAKYMKVLEEIVMKKKA
jgi:glycosyltransferase involved in cell wall biosynthesis